MAELSPGDLSAVELEVFRHALAGVAEEMGVALRTPPTSRNARTARPRCSTPAGRWSPRPSTSRCTWGHAGQRPSQAPDTTTVLAAGEVAVVDDADNLVVHLPG